VALMSVGTGHEHEWSKVLRALMNQRNIHEAVFVSTCLRTEVVAVIDRFHGAIEEITETLADATGLSRDEFADRLTVHFDRGVANHLFSVAAELKSVVPGEFEVLGQLRRALELATEEQTVGPELNELFQRAIASGRRVRNETQIARGTTSFAQASVTMATKELDVNLDGADVVIIGAGRLAGGIAKSLFSSSARLRRLTICNRTAERAERLRSEIGDARVDVAGLEHSRQNVLFVDLGIPCAVASEIHDLDNVRRIDIDDLRERVEHALDGRHEAVDAARDIVVNDVEKYPNNQRARGASTIASELREYFDDVVVEEMQRREHDLDDLTTAQRKIMASLVRSVVAKIAHRPTMALKEAAESDQGIRLSEATRNLFDL
jgi:glutamyl-tRNA reductase